MLTCPFLALCHRGPIRQRLDARRQSGISFDDGHTKKLDRFIHRNKIFINCKGVFIFGLNVIV
jgi:hypothetical protein